MTFPAVNFVIDGYAWTFDPAYLRSEFASGNTRQRKLMTKNNDVFSCRHIFTDAQAATMETYINVTLDKGSLTDTMPYYISEAQFTGTGQIVNGHYSMDLMHKNLWSFSYDMEVIRDMTGEGNVYGVVNAYSGFDGAYAIFNALEDMVNYNAL